jgi:hypothetical protein
MLQKCHVGIDCDAMELVPWRMNGVSFSMIAIFGADF